MARWIFYHILLENFPVAFYQKPFQRINSKGVFKTLSNINYGAFLTHLFPMHPFCTPKKQSFALCKCTYDGFCLTWGEEGNKLGFCLMERNLYMTKCPIYQ